MKRIIWVILAILALALSANAEEHVVWQIGDFDNSYDEFGVPHDYSAYWGQFRRNRTFRIGQSDPKANWPFIHPGPNDAWVRHREQPFTIVFNLPEQPAGTFTLTIDLVDTHAGSPPVYEITVNGRSGRFNLPRGAGDESLLDASKGREYILSIPMPANFLKAGENKLVLKSVQGSWLLYDALRLTNDTEGKMPEPSINRVTLTPTIRFVQQGSKLKQVVLLSAELSPGTADCTATVKVGATAEKVSLAPNLMGTAESEIYLDEIADPATAEVTLTSGNLTKSALCELKPQRHWKLYLQPSSHVDIGYTDFQERVIDRHNENMSLALELCRQYPDFKWNTEAAWVQDNYLSMMPEDRRAEFIKLAKEGRIGCQAIYGNMLTGICSHESFIRDLYYARAMAKRYGIPFDIAMSSDVPTQVWTLPTVLAGAGIRYFSAGLNLTRGDSFNRLFDKSPFYWRGPDGSEVLTWLSPGYAYAANLGLPAGAEEAGSRIESYLKSFDRDDYPYDAVLAFGGFGDNQPLNAGMAETVHQWNEKYAYPKIVLCRGPEFFEYVEANFRDEIPTISGCGGVYWEDGAASSALETTMVRCAKEKLAAAEKLHSLTSVLGGSAYPKADIESAWKNAILYDEHTWGAHCSISEPQNEQTVHQWQVKASFAQEAGRRADSVLQQGLENLAKTVSVQEPSVVVFNPLSWPVSGLVKTKTADGKPIEFWAENVPAAGYRAFPLPVSGGGQEGGQSEIPSPQSAFAKASAGEFENRFYRLEFDRVTGAVKSLYDKELKVELVDASAPYGLNEYIYIAGQGKDSKDVTRDASTPAAEFGSISYAAGTGTQVMSIRGSAYKTPEWSTDIILYDKIKRIDFVNTLKKEETYDKEAGYFAFPFALNRPEFYVELPNGVVRPKRDMLDGACMQWYCAQDFAAAADDGCAVIWTAVDSPLITIGDLNRETFKSPLPIENGHLYAYVFNNYWFTNYKASQGGELTFRFSLTSMPKYDSVEASRFGQSVRNPLLAIACGPDDVGEALSGLPKAGRPQRVAPTSLCSVAPSNIVVQAVKQAESGKGLIIRLREVAGKKTQATLTLPAGKFNEAWSCNLVEDPQSKLRITKDKVAVTVPASGLATVFVK